MLKSLKINNFVIIDNIEINFDSGFTAITGETGAGKSIIIDAIGLICGNRADNFVLKNKEQKSIIEATFHIKQFNLNEFFKSNLPEIDYEEEAIIRREILPNNKSRAFINDTPTNLTILKEFTSKIIDIHSQYENLTINTADFQMKLIDTNSISTDLIDDYRKNYSLFIDEQKEYKTLLENYAKNKDDSEYFTLQYQEIKELALKDGEKEELEQELKRLNNIEEIKQIIAKSLVNLEEENSILPKIKEMKVDIDKIKSFIKNGAEITSRLDNIYIEMKEITSDLNKINDNPFYNAEQIKQVEERISAIYQIENKYKLFSFQEYCNFKAQLEQKLSKIENLDGKLKTLEKSQKEQKNILQKLANEMSIKRKNILPKIETEITNSLQNLAIVDAQFKILHQIKDSFDKNGIDQFELLFSANKDMQLQKIEKVASGGEISRLMLAMKKYIAQMLNLPTIIFDEIDLGISGIVASKMGEMIKEIAKTTQVIAITHLPQIASKANSHLIVQKENKDKTTINISKIIGQDRINEIAKMLSDKELTEAARKNAEEMLK